jgi:hypothetical protein
MVFRPWHSPRGREKPLVRASVRPGFERSGHLAGASRFAAVIRHSVRVARQSNGSLTYCCYQSFQTDRQTGWLCSALVVLTAVHPPWLPPMASSVAPVTALETCVITRAGDPQTEWYSVASGRWCHACSRCGNDEVREVRKRTHGLIIQALSPEFILRPLWMVEGSPSVGIPYPVCSSR